MILSSTGAVSNSVFQVFAGISENCSGRPPRSELGTKAWSALLVEQARPLRNSKIEYYDLKRYWQSLTLTFSRL